MSTKYIKKIYSPDNQKYNVLILASGFGKRLMPYTQEIPKPLIKLGNLRAIDYLIEKYGLVANRFYINIGYIGDLLKFYLKGRYPQHEIIFIDDYNPEGTAESFMKAMQIVEPDHPLIFTFCDVLVFDGFELGKDLLVLNNEKGVYGTYKNLFVDGELVQNEHTESVFKNGVVGIGVIMHPRDIKTICKANYDKKKVEFTLDILGEYNKLHNFKPYYTEDLYEFGETKPYNKTRNFFNENNL